MSAYGGGQLTHDPVVDDRIKTTGTPFGAVLKNSISCKINDLGAHISFENTTKFIKSEQIAAKMIKSKKKYTAKPPLQEIWEKSKTDPPGGR